MFWESSAEDVSVKLSLPERFFVLMEEPTSSFAGVVVSNLAWDMLQNQRRCCLLCSLDTPARRSTQRLDLWLLCQLAANNAVKTSGDLRTQKAHVNARGRRQICRLRLMTSNQKHLEAPSQVGFMIGTLPMMKTAPCERCEPEQMRQAPIQSGCLETSVNIVSQISLDISGLHSG